MKITVTGSLGNTSRPLVERLVASGHEVQVITSTPERATAIAALGAVPRIGSVEDPAFVSQAFQGSEAVYLMIPPNFQVPDYNRFTVQVRGNYASAVQEAGVSRVVNLSSVGSALAGTPPLTGYQNLETALDQIPNLQVLHLRPGGFYSNFYGSLGLIHEQGMLGNNFGGDVVLTMSHPEDIAEAAAEAFNAPAWQGTQVVNIISDQKTGAEIAQILSSAVEKPTLNWIQFSDGQLLDALQQTGFSPDAAQHYIVDMGVAIREGLLDTYYRQTTHRAFGKRTLERFAQEFATVYRAAFSTTRATAD